MGSDFRYGRWIPDESGDCPDTISNMEKTADKIEIRFARGGEDSCTQYEPPPLDPGAGDSYTQHEPGSSSPNVVKIVVDKADVFKQGAERGSLDPNAVKIVVKKPVEFAQGAGDSYAQHEPGPLDPGEGVIVDEKEKIRRKERKHAPVAGSFSNCCLPLWKHKRRS